MFPTTERKESQKSITWVDTFLVYCKCRMPEDGRVMVQCSQCGELFHKLH